MSDERIKKAYDLAEKYGTAERECRWHESGLDADDCFRDLMIYVKGLVARIAELEAENDRLQYAWFRDETICPDGSLKPKVSTLLNRIAELEAERRWTPVGERLPEIGVRVLFYNNFIKNIHKGWYSGDEWVSEIGVFYNGDKLKRITHWMPLPKFPEVQE